MLLWYIAGRDFWIVTLAAVAQTGSLAPHLYQREPQWAETCD